MFKNRKTMCMSIFRRWTLAIAAAAMLTLPGCGESYAGGSHATPASASVKAGEESVAAAQDARPGPEPSVTPVMESEPGPESGAGSTVTSSGTAAVQETATPSPMPSPTPEPTPEPEPELAMEDPERIAALAELEGNWSFVYMADKCVIDVTESPYGLEWRYGLEPDIFSPNKFVKAVQADEWDDEWEAYVAACDWSLVFDADYYMEAFPILAELYEHDGGALLRHYQTVGIHEGRQANDAYCPAAYMDNCDEELARLFGDSPECYTVYYMLHYGPDQEELAWNGGEYNAEYPLWLSVEMSSAQSKELSMVNQYRKEAGADPVQPHPELMALADLRAKIDAAGHYAAHDWLDACKSQWESYMRTMGITRWSENTVKRYNAVKPYIDNNWSGYYNSPPHYEAMVRDTQKWFGTSDFWYAPDWTDPGTSVQFDIYTKELPNPGTNY